MSRITRLIPHGANISGRSLKPAQVAEQLRGLAATLEEEGLGWTDVSLVIAANAKAVSERKAQHGSDSAVTDGLRMFCEEQGWYPSLIGTTVHSAFYKYGATVEANIDSGLLFVAVINPVLQRVPIGVEITDERADRSSAGVKALNKAVKAYSLRLKDELGVEIPVDLAASTSTGIVFTSGSGHMDTVDDVDFRECYAVGYELLRAANGMNAPLFGGCATNKPEKANQGLYYSEEIGGRVHYRSSYEHAALVALIPHTPVRAHLSHPYKAVDTEPLDVDLDERDKFNDERFFFVRRINGRPVTEFLGEYWPGASEYLESWIDGHVAIPARPEAHGVTIASSATRTDETLWPNVAIWFERDDDGFPLLRLVRAVPRESNHFLMEMAPSAREALRRNAESLLESLAFTPGSAETSVLAFLCESRKMLLELNQSNVEADLLTDSPGDGALIGIYLNGEYSTNSTRSIGYHNYSQIAALIPAVETDNLPANIYRAMQARGLRLFACHNSDDKAAAREFISVVERGVPNARRWIDEEEVLVGEDIRETVERALENQRQFVIPYLTVAAAKSSWVAEELKHALEQELEQQRRFILPVVIDTDGGKVFKRLKKAWGSELYEEITDRLQVVVRSNDLEEVTLKATRLARDIRQRGRYSPLLDDGSMTNFRQNW